MDKTTNSTTRHTPGPWVVHPKLAQVDARPIDEDGRLTPICGLLWPTDVRTEDETFANAQLIAAAPRMAEALQRLLNSRHPYVPELHHTEAFRKYVVAESFAREALREAGVEQ